ncbi:hypothetical protein GCM10009689_17620 [Brevibacterium antiquum]|uniref:HNH endonuclease n=1 Tax=Brevibacterium antiquum TaxID=234835 RepID=UPI001E31F272|nr:HNH endonuclease signature motif containing protein [Brevibacterium antiquum]
MDLDIDAFVDGAGSLIDVITAVVTWLSAHTAATFVLAAVLIVIVIARAMARRTSTTDPTRLFTSDQRREGMVRAENRCEMPKLFGLMRCRRRAEHGDHFFPWSRGGATTMSNYVAACAKCNLAKSNHVPTRLTTGLIALRRRRYFPDGNRTQPGQRYQGI